MRPSFRHGLRWGAGPGRDGAGSAHIPVRSPAADQALDHGHQESTEQEEEHDTGGHHAHRGHDGVHRLLLSNVVDVDTHHCSAGAPPEPERSSERKVDASTVAGMPAHPPDARPARRRRRRCRPGRRCRPPPSPRRRPPRRWPARLRSDTPQPGPPRAQASPVRRFLEETLLFNRGQGGQGTSVRSPPSRPISHACPAAFDSPMPHWPPPRREDGLRHRAGGAPRLRLRAPDHTVANRRRCAALLAAAGCRRRRPAAVPHRPREDRLRPWFASRRRPSRSATVATTGTATPTSIQRRMALLRAMSSAPGPIRPPSRPGQ